MDKLTQLRKKIASWSQPLRSGKGELHLAMRASYRKIFANATIHRYDVSTPASVISLSAAVLFYFKNPISSFFFLGLIGISNGLANVLGSSTWAEIYGVKHIGSIKALTTALMVFATAFGTALFGILIDMGLTIESISIISGTYIFISIIMLFIIKEKLNPIYQQK